MSKVENLKSGRIGNRILAIPNGVTVTVNENNNVVVKGPKGELNRSFDKSINIEVKEENVIVTRKNDAIPTKQLHGTTNALIKNMMEGVSDGYKKELEIVGVGYRFAMAGNKITVSAGYSHPVNIEVPTGIKAEVNNNTLLTLTGIDKELVGEFASEVRKVRKPEPYKGKGIKYVGEHIRRKEGKKAK